jgi:hypothetical protein
MKHLFLLKMALLLVVILLTGCAHGVAVDDPFDPDIPPDFDAKEYNRRYDQKKKGPKADRSLFEQYYQREKNQK